MRCRTHGIKCVYRRETNRSA
ncbi:MAG: hypothetical protein B7X12_03040 [Halothiobacillus sp. 20-53-49]|nr:MAG: hypothetical protein B7X12_03040 [Halothiobacillus sp. 20-53-49]